MYTSSPIHTASCIEPLDPTNGYFGDSGDALLLGGFDYGCGATKDSAGVLSKLTSISIKGGVFGSSGVLPDLTHLGIVAEQIGSFKVNGVSLPLKSGAKNDTFALNAAVAVGASLSTNGVDGFAVHVIEV